MSSEVLLESDDDVCGKSSRKPSRHNDLKHVVAQNCTCCKKTCLHLFKGRISEVRALRKTFHDLSDGQKAGSLWGDLRSLQNVFFIVVF